ncbi:hypothetical protein WJX73_008949 [Symbiochloris irregularis]|uniref:RAB6-interacting golgin n=1 Tax=Symbiochloris irregularis TaxID=706552 RepID=A0AAW1NPE0_9CHLO
MTLDSAMSLTEEVREEQKWAAAGEKLVAANLVEKMIEAKERELQGCIALNYTRVREVEKELAQLQLQLRITAGPKRSALEMIRKKIELQNAKVVMARDRHKAAKQAMQAAEKDLSQEEAIKQRLCDELNVLVQQSATAQLDKLDQLTQRLNFLNQGYNGHADASAAQAQRRSDSPAGRPGGGHPASGQRLDVQKPAGRRQSDSAGSQQQQIPREGPRPNSSGQQQGRFSGFD